MVVRKRLALLLLAAALDKPIRLFADDDIGAEDAF
jgi:hypothetical protein